MNKLDKIEQEIQDQGIVLMNIKADALPCMCGHYGAVVGIAIDRSQISSYPGQITSIVHEYCHIKRGAYRRIKYNFETDEREERKVWDDTIDALLPADEFLRANSECEGHVWGMAEYFSVTEELINKAYALYRRRGYIPY